MEKLDLRTSAAEFEAAGAQAIRAFCHIEKCGGSTLIYLLRRNLMLKHCDIVPISKSSMNLERTDFEVAKRCYPKIISIAGHTVRYPSMSTWGELPILYYTLVRDPVERYISEYFFDKYRRGYPGSIEDWMQFEDRHNFQTRAFAGSADLERAKQVAAKNFSLIGCVEEYERFLRMLQILFAPVRFPIDYHVRNSRSKWAGARPSEVSAETRKEVLRLNSLDVELYTYIREKIAPEQDRRFEELAAVQTCDDRPFSSAVASTRVAVARLYRNLIYKPRLGYAPYKRHSLPRYRSHSGAYYGSAKE